MTPLRNHSAKPIANIIEDQLKFYSKAIINLSKLAGTYPSVLDPNAVEPPVDKLLEETIQHITEYLSIVNFQFCPAIAGEIAECNDKDISNRYKLLCSRLESEKNKILDVADKLTALRHKYGAKLSKKQIRQEVGNLANVLEEHNYLEISLKKSYNQAKLPKIKNKSQAILKMKNPSKGPGPRKGSR